MSTDFAGRIAALSPEQRALLEQKIIQRAASVSQQAPIPRRTSGEASPLSFGQERLWFFDQMEMSASVYNLATAFHLKGDLKLAVLERALSEIVRRHEVFRTTFRIEGEKPVQVIGQSWQLRLPLEDLSGWEERNRKSEVRRLVTEERNRRFDLTRDLVLRGRLIRETELDWILVLTTHHIASDGWSQGILLRELGEFYRHFLFGNGNPAGELKLQYADYAAWQRGRLRGEVLRKQLEYWKGQLGGELPVLELPVDRPRPALPTYRGGRQPWRIERELSEGLKKLCRQEGVTLFMLLLASFQVLLQRYSGQEEVAVGTPIAGRNRAELEGLIGFFANTLVMRTDLRGDPSFREVLQRVKEVALGAYEHQEVPFEKLVRALQPKRDLSRNPLFQVMFVLQNVPEQDLELSGLQVERMQVDYTTTMFDLTLWMSEEAGVLKGVWDYSADLFDAKTIERMGRHFEVLLQGVLTDPGERISLLPLLDENEQRRLIVEWNETKAEYPREKCVHDLIGEEASRTPKSVAAVFKDQQLTYEELDGKANQLARYLQKQGIGPGMTVGICLDRTMEMLIGVLGILKAGAAYVPLDPIYPTERIAAVIEDAGPSLLLTQEDVAARLKPAPVRFMSFDAVWNEMACESTSPPRSTATARDLAYVIFTSGSTGRPKGVQITHRSVVNLLTSMARHPGLTPQDRWLAVTTLSFDIAVLELFLPLCVGARVIIATSEVAGDGIQLQAQMAASGATIMQATPATWRLLLEAGWKGDAGLKILCGGEAMPRDLAEALRTRSSSVWNMYGPTETTVWSAVSRVDSADGPAPIGLPIANTRFYVLDKYGQLMPIGVPGELHIGGDGVAPGYWHKDDLTAEKFIRDPFCNNPEARLYRTGDLVRRLPDGMLEFMGRLDNQVKIRGFRIETSEVEAVLMQHPKMRECLVIAGEDTFGDRRLVAYVATEKPFPEISDLKSFVASKLPQYMVPSLFVTMESLPRLPNGKVNRRGLPAPDFVGAQSFVVPRNETEFRLAELWKQVLGVKAVSVTANFFDEGGHSLLAARLLSQIERTFGRRMSLAAFLRFPTIGSFAERLLEENLHVRSEQVHAIQPKGSRPPFFIFTSQPPLYRTLAGLLGPDQPIFGITSPEMSALPKQFTVRDIAANLLDSLCETQPHGPYFLGGWCVSGIVIFEMAQQLRSRGQEVALVALFDSWCPAYVRRFRGLKGLPARCYFFGQKWLYRLGKMRKMPPREALTHAWKAIQSARRNRQDKFGQYWLAATDEDPGAEMLRFSHLQHLAALAYEPKPYDSPVVLFRSQVLQTGRFRDPLLGWGAFTSGGLDLQELPGGHEDLFHAPAVEIMAVKLKQYLQAAVPSAVVKPMPEPMIR